MTDKHLTVRFLMGMMLTTVPALSRALETDSIYPHQNLDEVVVTRYKINRHNLTPVSVSTIGKAQIQAQQVTDISDMSALMPNFFIPEYGSRQTTPIAIRGVMSKVKGTAVGFYVDGVPHFETSAFNADLLDVTAIEVYRGPQGTLYGRNTIGGVINVYTHTPFDYQGTKVKIGYGNYNNMVAQFSNYTRLSQTFGLNVGGYYEHNDGYFKNTFLGKKADRLNAAGGKLGFYYNPTDRWKLRLTTQLDYTNQGGYPYAPYDTEKQQLSDIAYNRECGYIRTISTTGLMAHYAGNGFSLNSQTTFQHIHDNQSLDQDFTSADLYFVTNGVTQNTWNEEIVLKSETDGRFQWVAGVNGFIQSANQDQATSYFTKGYIQPAHYETPTQGAAAFAQGSYNIWRGLSATVGLRLDYEHSKIRYSREMITISDGTQKHLKDFSSSLHFLQLIPKFGLQYLFDDRNQVYANVTRGYKAGAFNQSFTTDDERSYDPEYNWNYEIGTKLSTRNGRFGGELTLFYIDWRNQQISHTVPSVGNVIDNAGHSDSKGVELSLMARPLNDLILTANYGYTYARFLDYQKNETTNYAGKMLPLVPRHTMDIGGQYTFHPRRGIDAIRLSADVQGVGKLYWNEDNAQVQPFYALLNAKAAFQKGIVTVELWGKNLTSTNYLSYYFVSSGKYAQKGKPLTFGANVILDL
ncbi:MAG: TonB-dependent receptor [Prevotella sp.]|nr:TonB-dependent receptor [Prevotella sp.]